METIEKPFPPEGFAFFASLMSYYLEQFYRLKSERDEQVQQFKAASNEKYKGLDTEFATHGISFREEVAPLFGPTFFYFETIKNMKAARALWQKECARRLNRYREAVRRISEDTAPFSRAARSEVKATWEWIENIDLTGMHDQISLQLWGEQWNQVSDSSKKEAWKHAIWGAMEKTLFSMLTGKGIRGQTYRLIELVWDILPDEFSAKCKSDAIRLRVKRKSPLRKYASPENGKSP